MRSVRLQQLKQICQSAVERPPAERDSFITEACGDDLELRREVEALVSSNDQAGGSFETVAIEAAQMVVGDRAMPLLGKRIGPYEVIAHIGSGGMGEVYLAEDCRLGRKVALKLLPSHFSQDRQRLERFKREARAASALNHPNILTVYEIGEAEGRPFIATEFIEGETLRSRLDISHLAAIEALDVAIQVASGLNAAHEAGIVHRDIKPENIMLRRDGYVKILDFGLAKLIERGTADHEESTLVRTDEGVILGTARYMSPEQARAQAVDVRTDLWSLGVVLYMMFSDHAPFEGETPGDMIVSILEREPPPIARYAQNVPSELDWIVKKALRKVREERYQTAKELLSDLKKLKQRLEFEGGLGRAAQTDLTVHLPIPTAEHPAARTGELEAHTTSSGRLFIAAIKRHKRTAALSGIVLLIATAVLLYFSSRAPALTERDSILLADFDNKTGDEVFDGALKQALQVQLEQSPFLNIFPEQRVRETLSYMGRAADERVTKGVGREICLRQGVKAMLVGSISQLGSHYVIGLECVNAQTGDAIAREQTEADNKEQVLRALGKAATKMREKLGESLPSIQRFDAPIEQATTPSLEALKAFTLGNEKLLAGSSYEAGPLFQHAVEDDPSFALAYAKLAITHYNLMEEDRAAQFATKAFELRERASERERFYIANNYYLLVTGELDKSIEVLELWKQTYPREFIPRINLSVTEILVGQYEKAAEEAREAIRLNPNMSAAYTNLGCALLRMNRFDEAREIFDQALKRKVDNPAIHLNLFNIAFIAGDKEAMRQQIDWAVGKPNEGLWLYSQAQAAACSGRRREAEELFGHSVEVYDRQTIRDGAASAAADDAMVSASFGSCQQAKKKSESALGVMRGKHPLAFSAVALALCGEVVQSHALAAEIVKRYPSDTLIKAGWLPMIWAAEEISRNNAAAAIQILRPAVAYEMGSEMSAWPAYIRGLAYLRWRAGSDAAAEFQKIIEHRGVVAASVLYPLAHLGLARAAALTGDKPKGRQAYEQFFALWQDADQDIPILREARQEYERVK